MAFTSFLFVGLVLVTLFLYYLPFLSKSQVLILITSSLVFYSYNQPVLVLLLLFSVAINIVSSYYVVNGNVRHRKLFATAGVSLNLLLLIFFKYSPLFGKLFFSGSGSVGQFLVSIPLPIGISFYTFQGISLVVDVYRAKPEDVKKLVPKSFLLHAKHVLFFKSFFPQLISGPIVKAHDFIPQIEPKKMFDIEWDFVAKNMILGYFLKMVVADNLKDFTFWISFPYFQAKSSLTLLIMLFGYSCQIFADFAGYSLIAIALAKLFGYTFKANFNFPYISTSFKEFWKRWHISLSSFLMEYLYIPLGGNRKGKVRTYINLFIVMLLGGLWHGAAWSYAIWGTFHGVALAIEKFLSEKIRIPTNFVTKCIRGFVVFAFVTLAWLLFKLPDFIHVIDYFKCIGNNIQTVDDTLLITYILLYSVPVLLYHLYYLLAGKKFYVTVKKYEHIFYGILFFMIIVNSGSAGNFIYFQF